MSKPLQYMMILATICCAGTALAKPFDLDYRVSGVESLRPKLVFNDGYDTFIEGDESLRTIGLPSERQGPYLVVRGIPERVVMEGAGMRRVSIIYTGSAVTPAMLVQQSDKSQPCDKVEMTSKHVDLYYGSTNAKPNTNFKKSLQQRIPEILSSDLTQIIISSGEVNVAEKRAAFIKEFLLKNSVPQSKFSIRIVDDQTGQIYLLIGNSPPCIQTTPRKTNTVNIPKFVGTPQKKEISPANVALATGNVDGVLKMLADGEISQEEATTMIAGIHLANNSSTLEKLYVRQAIKNSEAPKKELQNGPVAQARPANKISPDSKPAPTFSVVKKDDPKEHQHQPALSGEKASTEDKPSPIFNVVKKTNPSGPSENPSRSTNDKAQDDRHSASSVAVTAPVANENEMSGKFSVIESKKQRQDNSPKENVFLNTDFAQKPTAQTMARIAKIVREQYQNLYVVKNDDSKAGKTAAAYAAKSLLRLGVESIRFDRGANEGEIVIMEDGIKK